MGIFVLAKSHWSIAILVDPPLWQPLAILGCFIVSFFCSGAETALTSLTEARTRQLIEAAGEAAGARHPLQLWLKQRERLLSTLLFANTLANIGASSLATEIVMGLGSSYAVAISTGITTFIVLTFCEVLPKSLSMRFAVPVALRVMPIVRLLYWLLLPFTTLLLLISSSVWRLGGGAKALPAPPVTGEEIEYLIGLGSRSGVLDEVKKELLNSVLEFADLKVKEIMVPRLRMIGIERATPFHEAARLIAESEHSRLPIYDESIDNVVGLLVVRDVITAMQKGLDREQFDLMHFAKPAFFVPELMKISRLLREFQRRKTHMAVVVDEFGGTSGLVTLEDVVEEIVGEIQDEHDAEERSIKALGDGRFLIDASTQLREVEEALGAEFPDDGDYETLGGFLTAIAGKVPAAGTLMVWEGLSFVIRQADERRVSKVEVARATRSELANAKAAQSGMGGSSNGADGNEPEEGGAGEEHEARNAG